MPSAPVFRSTLDAAELTGYVERLLANHLPDGRGWPSSIADVMPLALERVEHCFSRIHRKYFTVDGVTEFDHQNGDHLAAFLYLLANSAYSQSGDVQLATKLFQLNKIMHGLDLFYSVTLPEVFLLVHPVGSVIGNATYSDYLVIYQGCTVGADKGIYPRFGEGVVLYSRSSVLGDSTVGHDVVFAANSFVLNADVPADSIVTGQFPTHRVHPNDASVRSRIFEPAVVTS